MSKAPRGTIATQDAIDRLTDDEHDVLELFEFDFSDFDGCREFLTRLTASYAQNEITKERMKTLLDAVKVAVDINFKQVKKDADSAAVQGILTALGRVVEEPGEREGFDSEDEIHAAFERLAEDSS